eukprot:symbB.v1.2.037227.t1/scaffold5437.1/size27202/1
MADRVAVQVNQQRSSGFWQLLSEAQETDGVWLARIAAVRQFYFKVAEARSVVEPVPLISITDEDLLTDGEPLNSFFFHGWQSFCPDDASSHLPLRFGVQILEWLFDLEQAHGSGLVQISFLELTFLISSEALIPFPFFESRRDAWAYQFPCQRLERPTLSYLYRTVRSVLLGCFSNLDLSEVELGINVEHIMLRMQGVALFKKLDEEVLRDADLSGPLMICLTLGLALLLAGKLQFGYVYGLAAGGSFGICCLINVMSQKEGIDLYRTMSILGYGLIPIVFLAIFGIIVSLKSSFGSIMAAICIAWATASSSRFFAIAIHMEDQRWLVAYPVGLVYTFFTLITIF